MGFISDFKAFAMQGNVIDLAVGVVIGAAFGKIVTALVDDIIMPVLSLVTGGRNFDNLYVVLNASEVTVDPNMTLEEAKKAGANVLAYGHLLGSIVDFIIIAFCIFLVVRAIARMYRKKEEAAAAPPAVSGTDTLLMEIRDELRRRN
jgi:large conductance mechanosensitive channel